MNQIKAKQTMKKIMIMEDDPRIATALAVRLEAAGYEVLTVPDGFRGLTATLEDPPDLLLMDIWMPVGTGFSVAQRLQALGMSRIPIIFITASKVAGLRDTAEKLGAVAFFEKPYDSQQLLGAIARALQTKLTEEPVS
jgi:two-component system copper resistance phosphate regulon response regulator CusR